MSIFREVPPTAGFPLYFKDFFSIFSQQDSLEKDFKDYLNVPYSKFTYSGTAAFYIILESLKKLSSKKTVIIPAFLCPLIPLAIRRAGLKAEVCDINKDNFDFDIPQLQELCSKNKDILAIVAVHLAGIPVDFDEIKQIAQKDKIFIIEDCAQSLGAIYKGKKVGTLGEFSFFSLCRGKGLTTYEGGVIVTKQKEYSTIINSTIKKFVKNYFFSETLKVVELFGYWIFYRPSLFWFAWKLPQMFWESRGETLKALTEYFTIDFPTHKVSKFRKSVGHCSFPRLEKEINNQRLKASIYTEGLKNVQGIKIISESAESKATYPYLTLIFDDPMKRENAKEKFKNLGLGVFQIYCLAITDYAYLKGTLESKACPNARYLAQRHITLSTSTFLKDRELDSVINIIRNL